MFVLIRTKIYEVNKSDFPPVDEIQEEAPSKKFHERHHAKVHFVRQVCRFRV